MHPIGTPCIDATTSRQKNVPVQSMPYMKKCYLHLAILRKILIVTYPTTCANTP